MPRFLSSLTVAILIAALSTGCALYDAFQGEDPDGEPDAGEPDIGEPDVGEPDTDHLNPCGGTADLLFDGEPAELDSPCGRCDEGALACDPDDDNALLCAGERAEEDLNVCGGCDSLIDVELGAECDADGLPGFYICEDLETISCAALSCDAEDLDEFQWPLDGEHGLDWVITGYVELVGPNDLPMDYTGITGDAARVGPDPETLTVALATYAVMDEAVEVRAPIAGVVIAAEDGHHDRHYSCDEDNPPEDNHVTLQLENGFQLRLGQLRRGFVAVDVGDEVEAGDLLGHVGGSGCTGEPALALRLADCAGDPLSTFDLELWGDEPPEYNPPPRFMSAHLVPGNLEDDYYLVDPPPSVRSVRINEPHSHIVAISNANNDSISPGFAFIGAGGQSESIGFTTAGSPIVRVHVFRPSLSGGGGFFPHTLEYSLDGQTQITVELSASEHRGRAWALVRADRMDFEADAFRTQTFGSDEFHPLDFHPFFFNGWTYLIVGFSSFLAEHVFWFDQDLTTHQDLMEMEILSGGTASRPTANASYMTPDGPRYAGLWRRQTSINYTYGVHENQRIGAHTSSVNSNAASGRYPNQARKLFIDDEWRYTALFDDLSGAREIEEDVPVEDFDDHVDARLLSDSQVPYSLFTYLNEDGEERLMVVWQTAPSNIASNLEIRDDLTPEELHFELTEETFTMIRAFTPYTNDQGQTRFIYVVY